jgi:protein required for attachment to host cells
MPSIRRSPYADESIWQPSPDDAEDLMQTAQWWIIVCDAARARVFEGPALGERMTEVLDWIEPAGRMSGRELSNDRPGRGMDRARGGRHAMEPPLDVHDKAEEGFAQTLAERLAQAHADGRFEQLALIAPPGMLGRLRPALNRTCPGCCPFDWARDLSNHSAQEIADHLKIEQIHRKAARSPDRS